MLRSVNTLLSQPGALSRNLGRLLEAARELLRGHEEGGAIYGEAGVADELRPLLSSVAHESFAGAALELELLLVKVLKVLLRKPVNRVALGRQGVALLAVYLSRQSPDRNTACIAEACNALVNACYDSVNVQYLVDIDGVRTVTLLLRSSDVRVQSSVLGAIQGVCYTPYGRQSIRQDRGVLGALYHFLNSEDAFVRARAVGSIHNLSVDIVSIPFLRDNTECIPAVVRLLRDQSPEICKAAAGTLQNLCRDLLAKEMVMGTDAVEFLIDLLCSTDLPCQVVAIGTILNIMGSSLTGEQKRVLNKCLTDGLVLGAVRSCIFEDVDIDVDVQR